MSLDLSDLSKIKCRGGYEFRLLSKGYGPYKNRLFVRYTINGEHDCQTLFLNGMFYSDGNESQFDLIMADETPPQETTGSENVSKAPSPAPKIVQILASSRADDVLYALDSDGKVWQTYWSTSQRRWVWEKLGKPEFS